jgi:hypothetical protein
LLDRHFDRAKRHAAMPAGRLFCVIWSIATSRAYIQSFPTLESVADFLRAARYQRCTVHFSRLKHIAETMWSAKCHINIRPLYQQQLSETEASHDECANDSGQYRTALRLT